jgi:hypothetical protein
MSPRISVPMPRSAASRFWGLGGLGAAATIFNEARATAGYDYYRRDARPRETAPGKLRVGDQKLLRMVLCLGENPTGVPARHAIQR